MSFYAVRKGINPGIYLTWPECNREVTGFKGAEYKKFSTKIEAENFINRITTNIITSQIQTASISSSIIQSITSQIPNGIDPNTTIYSDGAFNPHTKPDAWGSVVNGYGNDLIGYYSPILSDMTLKEVILPVGKRVIIVVNFNDVSTQQNNGAELMAAVAALRIAITLINSGIPVRTVFCDSQTVLYWSVKLKQESANNFDQRKVIYINQLIQLKKQFERLGGQFEKIPGNSNLADLGHHKG